MMEMPWTKAKRIKLESEMRVMQEEESRAKAVIEEEQRVKQAARAYAGAEFGRLLTDWIAGSTSGDAEVRSSIRTARNRARQLSRDNDWVRGFLLTLQNNVIGKGIKFQAQTKGRDGKLNSALNSSIEKEWRRWNNKRYCHTGGRLHFFEIERLSLKTTGDSGEMYVRFVNKSFAGSRVPLALQLIEGDQIDESMNGRAANGNEIRMGVEIDEWSRPVAYYITPFHPGDYQFTNGSDAKGRTPIRVLADDLIPLFISERVNQTRGIPWMISAIIRLHQMGKYEEAEVVSARATASLMGFIESPEGEVSGDGVVGEKRVTEFAPGIFKYLNPGEKVTVPALNRPSGEFDPFMRAMLRGVAAGVGSSYEGVSKDYSQSNYSSSRLGIEAERDGYRVLQEWMVLNFHQVVYERWLEAAVLSGAVKIPDYELNREEYHAARWMPRGWAYIDPYKDVVAGIESMNNGLESRTKILAQKGQDFEEMMLQIKREKEFMEENGLEMLFASNPNNIAILTKEAQPKKEGTDE